MSWRPLGLLAPNIISMGVLLLGVEGVQAAFWVFQVAFKWCFRGSVLNGVSVARFCPLPNPLPRERGLGCCCADGGCFTVAGVFRSCVGQMCRLLLGFQAACTLMILGAGCFQVALNAWRGFRRTGRAWLGFGFV